MRVLIPILLFYLSIEATEQYCTYMSPFYDICRGNGVINRIVEKSPPTSKSKPEDIGLFDNTTIEPYILNNTSIRDLEIKSYPSWSDTHDNSYTLSLAPASLASSTLTSLHLNHVKVNLTEGRLIGLDSVRKLTIENSWASRLCTELFPFFPNLEELYIYRHRLPVIPAQSFIALKQLKNLKIYGYHYREPLVLTTLELGCFDGLENLETLELLTTRMNSVPPVFDGLSKLRSLTIQMEFSIETIDGSIFRNLSSLTNLDLSTNRLTFLEPGTFDGLPRLTEIKLEINNLNAIPKGLFNKLTAVKKINLDSNNISTIETDAFSGLSLSQLNLYAGFARPVGQIQPGAFNNLTVNELNLGLNDLSSIPPKSFNGLNAITVNLKLNQLSKIRSDDFIGLKTIHLDLSMNHITEIEPLAFKNTEVGFINLKDNNLQRGNKTVWGLPESVRIVPRSLSEL